MRAETKANPDEHLTPPPDKKSPVNSQLNLTTGGVRPNIIFLTVDGLRPDRLGFFGRKPNPSPFIDNLIANGLHAPRTYTTGCPSQFAFPSMMTSSLPLDEGGYEDGLLHRSSSWIEILQSHGYRTSAFVTNQWLPKELGWDRGISKYYELYDISYYLYTVLIFRVCRFIRFARQGKIPKAYAIEKTIDYLGRMLPYAVNFCQEKIAEQTEIAWNATIHRRDFASLTEVFLSEHQKFVSDPTGYAKKVVDSTCSCLPFYYLALKHVSSQQKPSCAYLFEHFMKWATQESKGSSTQPFFSWMHIMDVHDTAMDKSFMSHDIQLSLEDDRRSILKVANQHVKINAESTFKGSVNYDLAVTYVDDQIERLHRMLEQRGLAENTLVVLSADHGIPGGYPIRKTGVWNFHEELYRVPLVFSHPKIQPEAKQGIATTMDIGPTILQLAGIPIPPEYMGQSLVTRNWEERDEFITENLSAGPADFETKDLNICVVKGSVKLDYRIPPDSSDCEGTVVTLFDLETDPEEARDIKYRLDYQTLLNELVDKAIHRARQIRNIHCATT